MAIMPPNAEVPQTGSWSVYSHSILWQGIRAWADRAIAITGGETANKHGTQGRMAARPAGWQTPPAGVQ
jgi:hypothetical protein